MNEPSETARITTDSRGRAYWASRPYALAVAEEVKHADIVILPQEREKDGGEPAFPVGTEELLLFLRDSLPNGTTVDVAVVEDEYRELALHGALLIVGAFLTTAIAVPILVNVVSEYIKKKIWRESSDQVRVKILVERRPGDLETVAIEYEGPSKAFAEAMTGALAKALAEEVPGARAQNMPNALPPKSTGSSE